MEENAKSIVEYTELLRDIKTQVLSSQVKAITSVNRELIVLYWNIGNAIIKKQKREGWGAKVINRLEVDLKNLFPNATGFSTSNMKNMIRLAKAYTKEEIGQQLVAQIPWGHNILIINRLSNKSERLWYVNKTMENGWSRNVLNHFIKTDLYNRTGKSITNFKEVLPDPQSDLAQELLKDPYDFSFLNLVEKCKENKLEKELLKYLKEFLLELGSGFAFVGQQYKIVVEDDEYFVDLLFYHTELECYVAIELKARKFMAEDVGKMNLYISAIDDLVKKKNQNSTIGLLLCESKKSLSVKYALKGIGTPIGVSEYNIKLPKDIRKQIPSPEEIKTALKRKSATNKALKS